MENELDLAKSIATGNLTSPQLVKKTNYALLDLRITGTGATLRDDAELVYRPESTYLTDDAVAMCSGLPVIFDSEHPKKGINQSSNVIGSIFYPYLKNSEIWGIAKITDLDSLNDIIQLHKQGEQLHTSSFVWHRPEKTTLENGLDIEVDGKPKVFDHLLITDNLGNWDKLKPETISINLNGINMAIITDPDKTENEAAETSGGDTTEVPNDVLKALLTAQQHILKRLDAIESGGGESAPVEPAKDMASCATEPAKDAGAVVVEPAAEVETSDQQAEEDSKMAELESRISVVEQGLNDEEKNELEKVAADCQVAGSALGISFRRFPTDRPRDLRIRACESIANALMDNGVKPMFDMATVKLASDSSPYLTALISQAKSTPPKAVKKSSTFVVQGQFGTPDVTHYKEPNLHNYFLRN